MIDIHTHIMPGIDDGADSMEEALAMAEMAWDSGVSTIVVTPHSNVRGCFENYDSPEWRKLFEQLKNYLKEMDCPIQLLTGAEIYASNHVAERIAEGLLLPIHNSRYYLMEIPFDADPYWAEEIWESVLDMGKIPVIAHPERYDCIQDNPVILYEWMKMGCLSQMNKGSIFGRFGRTAQKTAEILLDNNLITCAASDAHSSYMRTTYMADIRDYLLDMYGEEKVEHLLYRNPKRMIENRVIYNDDIFHPEQRSMKRRSFFNRGRL
ncbi:MAG: hypothetical protein E7253_08795 [Lachnospiraceae bacterium]|nr:hypothetical protein [Lachnospiraceae bacterium]